MKLDATGRVFIESCEGLSLTAYLDVAGVPTIGYGTTIYPTGKKVKLGDVCTASGATNYFSRDLVKFEDAVNKNIQVPLTQNQFNALVSFAYNIGAGVKGFSGSSVKNGINTGMMSREEITQCWLRWNKVRINGKLVVSDGLTNRRKKEIELYFSA